jgi:hypothetical protein
MEDAMRIKAAVLAVTLCMFAGSAYAGSTWIGGNGGVGLPTGDYGDMAATGWHLGGTAMRQVNENWGFGGELGYHSWGGSNLVNVGGDKWNFSAVQATGQARFMIPSSGNVKPYLSAGVGMYSFGAKLTSASGNMDTSESDMGFNFGAGMNFMSKGNSTWGFDGSYHVINTSGTVDATGFNLGVHMLWNVSH